MPIIKKLTITVLNDALRVIVYTFRKEVLRCKLILDVMKHPVQNTACKRKTFVKNLV